MCSVPGTGGTGDFARGARPPHAGRHSGTPSDSPAPRATSESHTAMSTQTPRLPAEPHRKQSTGSRLVMIAMILAVVDDLHRPDDRRHRVPHDPARPPPDREPGAVGDHRLPGGPRGDLRARRPCCRRLGTSPDAARRRRGIRRDLRPVWHHPRQRVGRVLADHVSRRPGRLRGAADARRDRHRLRECVPREARPVDGDVLRADRRVHGPGPDPRRLPARLLVAGDLLGEPAGRRGRGRPHPGRAHSRDPHPGAHRLARSRAGRHRHGAERPRVLAVLELGLDQRRDPGAASPAAPSSWLRSSSSSCGPRSRWCG